MLCRPRSGARQLHSRRPRRRQPGRAGGSSFPSPAPRRGRASASASARTALRPLPHASRASKRRGRSPCGPSGGLLAPPPALIPHIPAPPLASESLSPASFPAAAAAAAGPGGGKRKQKRRGRNAQQVRLRFRTEVADGDPDCPVAPATPAPAPSPRTGRIPADPGNTATPFFPAPTVLFSQSPRSLGC